MLGQIMNMAEKTGVLKEDDFMTLSEKEVMERLDKTSSRLYKTFRTMTSIEHTQAALDENEYFCVNLKVKQRYINPLVKSAVVSTNPSTPLREHSTTVNAVRLSEISEKARRIIEDFKTFSDIPYGCVKLV